MHLCYTVIVLLSAGQKGIISVVHSESRSKPLSYTSVTEIGRYFFIRSKAFPVI